MERVKLKFPSTEPLFKSTINVQIGDLNYGNHVGNDRILLMAHECRQQFLDSINQSELSFFDTSLIMSDSICVYKSQAFWKDQIECSLYLEELTTTAVRFFYQLQNISSKKDIAHVITTLIFFNYDTNKITPINLELLKF